LDIRCDLEGGGEKKNNRLSERGAFNLISDHVAGVLAFSNFFFSCNSFIFIGSIVCENSFLAYLNVVVTVISIFKVDVEEVGGGRGDWMELAQNRDRWRALVSTVKNLRVP
jgi:hypothetical protein